MPPPLPKPFSRFLLPRILTQHSPFSNLTHRHFSTPTSSSTQQSRPKLERIADDLLSLNKLERYDYSILFRLRLGLNNSAPSLAGLDPSAVGQQPGSAGAGKEAVKEEKTAFDVKLEKYDAAVKIKVIKEVRGFTELGLKEAKDMVEKAPIVVKKGVSKEEGNAIIEKMKALGATVVLE